MSLNKDLACSGPHSPLVLGGICWGCVLWGSETPWHDWQVSLRFFEQITMVPRGAETVAPEYHRWGQVEGDREQG